MVPEVSLPYTQQPLGNILSLMSPIHILKPSHFKIHFNKIKVQLDATVCSLIYFTAKSLYMFRVSQHPSSGVLRTVTAASGAGHTVKYTDELE